MFCPRCGRNLADGDNYCPECGYVVREMQSQTHSSDDPGAGNGILFLIFGFTVMFLLSYYVGFFFLFFFIPVLTIGGRRSRWQMMFIGAMLGTVGALLLRMML